MPTLLSAALLLVAAGSAHAASGLSAAALGRSVALAQQVWHPAGCASVSLKTYRPGDATEDDVDSALGFALPDRCTVEINWPLLRQWADSDAYTVDVQRTRQIWGCTVIVHEVGHLADYRDPIGAPILDANGKPFIDDFSGEPIRDPRHSPNPHNVMYPYLRFTYPPCRRLFPAARGAHIRPDSFH